MSVENVKKFYEAVSQDKELQLKFISLSQKYQGQQMDEAKMMMVTEQEVLPLAAQLGYSFTMGDLKSFSEEMKQANMNCELSDAELEAVAGGNGIWCICLGYNSQFNCLDGGLCIFIGMVSRV